MLLHFLLLSLERVIRFRHVSLFMLIWRTSIRVWLRQEQTNLAKKREINTLAKRNYSSICYIETWHFYFHPSHCFSLQFITKWKLSLTELIGLIPPNNHGWNSLPGLSLLCMVQRFARTKETLSSFNLARFHNCFPRYYDNNSIHMLRLIATVIFNSKGQRLNA